MFKKKYFVGFNTILFKDDEGLQNDFSSLVARCMFGLMLSWMTGWVTLTISMTTGNSKDEYKKGKPG